MLTRLRVTSPGAPLAGPMALLAHAEVQDVARVAAELKRLAKVERARDPKSRVVKNRRAVARAG